MSEQREKGGALVSEWNGGPAEDRQRAQDAALKVTQMGTYFGGGRARFIWVARDTWLIDAAQSAPSDEGPEPREPIDVWQALADALWTAGLKVVSRDKQSAGNKVRKHFLGASALTTFALADARDELVQGVVNWANLCATKPCVREAQAALKRRRASGEIEKERYLRAIAWLAEHAAHNGLHPESPYLHLDLSEGKIEIADLVPAAQEVLDSAALRARRDHIRPADSLLVEIVSNCQPPDAELITVDRDQQRAARVRGVRVWNINESYPAG